MNFLEVMFFSDIPRERFSECFGRKWIVEEVEDVIDLLEVVDPLTSFSV